MESLPIFTPQILLGRLAANDSISGSRPTRISKKLMATKHSILLTGGAGFIGTHILSMFPETQFVVADIQSPQQKQPNTIYIKADVRSEADMLPIFEQHRFDCVLHLAAAHKDFGVEQEEYFEVNENGTALVSQLAGQYGIKKFIFFSSVAVYGDCNTPTTDKTQPNPSNDYGASKLAAEQVLNRWWQQDESRTVIIIRPALVFGEGNVANMFRLIDQINKGLYFNVGKGDNIKSIAYVKNLVEVTWYLLEYQQSGIHIYNYADQPHLRTAEIGLTIAAALGKPKPKSIPMGLLLMMAKPFDLLIKMSGKDLPISSHRVKKYGTQTYHQAQQIFADGFKPKYTTRDGLAKMVAWYKESVQKNGK